MLENNARKCKEVAEEVAVVLEMVLREINRDPVEEKHVDLLGVLSRRVRAARVQLDAVKVAAVRLLASVEASSKPGTN
jgi:hypothetical protein